MKKPELMSHYTSVEGLKSIISTEVIQATNVQFLKDKSEYVLAFDIFKNCLNSFSTNFNVKKKADAFFLHECDRCIYSMNEIGAEHHYITSFSTNTDQSHQWREYGSIGIIFNIEKMMASINNNSTSLTIVKKCKYDEELLENYINRKILSLYKKYKAILPTVGRDGIYSLMTNLEINLYYIAAFFKLGDYKKEDEIRISCPTPENVKYRPKDSNMIPYAELLFDRTAIESIVIGPSIDFEKAKKSISMFLNENFSSNPPSIIRSEISLTNC